MAYFARGRIAIWLCILIVLAISGCSQRKVVESLVDPQTPLVIADGNELLTFRAVSPLAENVVFFDRDPLYAYKSYTADAFFAMSPGRYRQFLSLSREGTCPANFLNDNLQMYLVMTDDESVLRNIRSLRKGDPVVLSGYNLTMEREFIKPKAVHFTLSAPEHNAHLVFLNDISLAPQAER